MDDEPRGYHCAVPGHPMIKEGRWYIGSRAGDVIVVDQPMLGFATEGACRMYILDMGPQAAPNIGTFGGKVKTDMFEPVSAERIA